ncbi:hypothetical protein CEXT_744001 [Caerostris extrusa]|uniref:Uncharacterized protein n=1 Tax=Caerostris extrusa TaxID=172846 RepID=A0AAV4QRP6_CAEEX|nr:hypothetical protein CEXT_744001 [Caerostris extrusa]
MASWDISKDARFFWEDIYKLPTDGLGDHHLLSSMSRALSMKYFTNYENVKKWLHDISKDARFSGRDIYKLPTDGLGDSPLLLSSMSRALSMKYFTNYENASKNGFMISQKMHGFSGEGYLQIAYRWVKVSSSIHKLSEREFGASYFYADCFASHEFTTRAQSRQIVEEYLLRSYPGLL